MKVVQFQYARIENRFVFLLFSEVYCAIIKIDRFNLTFFSRDFFRQVENSLYVNPFNCQEFAKSKVKVIFPQRTSHLPLHHPVSLSSLKHLWFHFRRQYTEVLLCLVYIHPEIKGRVNETFTILIRSSFLSTQFYVGT